jgi:flagellin
MASIAGDAMTLDKVSSGVFEQALSNVAFLRAQAGGAMSRLHFSADSLALQETNIRAAVGRIEDVDIAAETANLAKYSILTQAAAAMVAQANTTNDVALMLLR